MDKKWISFLDMNMDKQYEMDRKWIENG